jgi:protein-S-isoprenylcysteine O-methyltransferase Ste14
MNDYVVRFKYGRFIWTVLAALYFVIFFVNFFRDAAPGRLAVPVLFATVFVLWLSLEYYFGSPFFQSGTVEPSALWRGVFAFFIYPFLMYVAADFVWWHWTQIPAPPLAFGVIGLVVFGVGTYFRLTTLSDILRIAQVKSVLGAKGKAPVEHVVIPERKFMGLRFQRRSRHPRYVATLIQMVGMSLVFNSWGGLALTLVVGLPLVLVQARHEDGQLRAMLRGDFQNYAASVPFFWPVFGRTSR